MPNCISSPWIAVIIKRSRSSITRNLTSNCTRMSVEIKSFVFLDSETTGLPLWEKNRTKITELCFTVVSSDHLKLGVFPRVQNKLTFCFNPRKYIDSEASKITGLCNELLEFQPEFKTSTVNVINEFLNIHQKPICFVAHNGLRFDYPILRAEIHKAGGSLPDDILCIDTLEMFRHFHKKETEENLTNEKENSRSESKNVPVELCDDYDQILVEAVESIEKGIDFDKIEKVRKMNEVTPQKNIIVNESLRMSDVKSMNGAKKRLNFGTPSFKLVDIYERLLAKTAVDQHRAECDVNMMVECAAKLGEDFVKFANENAKKFCDVPMMTPGSKIGF